MLILKLENSAILPPYKICTVLIECILIDHLCKINLPTDLARLEAVPNVIKNRYFCIYIMVHIIYGQT